MIFWANYTFHSILNISDIYKNYNKVKIFFKKRKSLS